jgi:hypothetical protein
MRGQPVERTLKIAGGLLLIALAGSSFMAAVAIFRVPERIAYWPLPRHWFPSSWVRRDRLTQPLAYVEVA